MNKRRDPARFEIHDGFDENRTICLVFEDGTCWPICVSGEHFDLSEGEMVVNRLNAYLGLREARV